MNYDVAIKKQDFEDNLMTWGNSHDRVRGHKTIQSSNQNV